MALAALLPQQSVLCDAALAPIFVQLSKNASGAYSYNPVTVNFLVELVKTLVAGAVLAITGRRARGGPTLSQTGGAGWLQSGARCRLLVVPASLYALNNYLKFVMQLFFKPTSAKMLGNVKVLTIAVLLKIVMGRSFSVLQWEALFLLVAGVTINQLSNCDGGGNLGFTPAAAAATLGSVTLPSCASVFNEYGFKRDIDASVHLQNFWLYFYGLLANALALLAWLAYSGTHVGDCFRGLNLWVALLIVNNALQGIVASFFYKYADTILKKYSSTLATMFTGIMSAVVFFHPITINFVIGISVVFISMHQFFTDGDKRSRAASDRLKMATSPSMDHFLADKWSPPARGNIGETTTLLPR